MDRLKPLNDFAFQKALGEKGDEEQLLAFLNAVLRRTGKDNLKTVEILEAKDLPAEIAGGKSGKLDVLAKLADGSRVNIEVQIKNEHNIEKRSLYYWGRKYISGLSSGVNYGSLSPVIAINIIDFEYLPIDDFHTSYHLWEDRHKDSMLTDVCEIHFLDMVKFRRLKKKRANKEPPAFSLGDPLHRWLTYFDEHSPPEMVEEVLKMDPAIQMVQDKMDMIARDPALLRTYEQYEKAELDYASGIDGARRDGLREGEQKGLQKGKIEVAKNLKKTGVLTPNQISAATGLPLDEIAKL
jgi:predicted transposase/invertase (TIGR01784 family)